MSKSKLLKTAIENQRWELAAHALVLGAVQIKIKENNDKKRGSTRESECQETRLLR